MQYGDRASRDSARPRPSVVGSGGGSSQAATGVIPSVDRIWPRPPAMLLIGWRVFRLSKSTLIRTRPRVCDVGLGARRVACCEAVQRRRIWRNLIRSIRSSKASRPMTGRGPWIAQASIQAISQKMRKSCRQNLAPAEGLYEASAHGRRVA